MHYIGVHFMSLSCDQAGGERLGSDGGGPNRVADGDEIVHVLAKRVELG